MSVDALDLALEKVANALPAYIDGVASRQYLSTIYKALAQPVDGNQVSKVWCDGDAHQANVKAKREMHEGGNFMNDLKSAAKQALDWFKCNKDGSMSRNNAEALADEVIKALEEALAKQEGQSNFCAQCEALGRELKAIKQEQGEPVAWQRIESAPKDGTRILCQDRQGFVDICEWTHCVVKGDRFTSSDDRTFGGGPAYTSWMPIPPIEAAHGIKE